MTDMFEMFNATLGDRINEWLELSGTVDSAIMRRVQTALEIGVGANAMVAIADERTLLQWAEQYWPGLRGATLKRFMLAERLLTSAPNFTDRQWRTLEELLMRGRLGHEQLRKLFGMLNRDEVDDIDAWLDERNEAPSTGGAEDDIKLLVEKALAAEGYQLLPAGERQTHWGGAAAVVGLKGGEVVVVECKYQMGTRDLHTAIGQLYSYRLDKRWSEARLAIAFKSSADEAAGTRPARPGPADGRANRRSVRESR